MGWGVSWQVAFGGWYHRSFPHAVRLLAAVIGVAAIAAGVWLMLLGEAPPGLPSSSDAPIADAASRTETAVTWVPRLGPRDYGDCTRILSLDGGGVRGLVPALILAEIEERTGRPIYQQFDLIVGTSTGSILALGLTRPSDADARRPAFAAKDLVQLYRAHAARIFPYRTRPSAICGASSGRNSAPQKSSPSTRNTLAAYA